MVALALAAAECALLPRGLNDSVQGRGGSAWPQSHAGRASIRTSDSGAILLREASCRVTANPTARS